MELTTLILYTSSYELVLYFNVVCSTSAVQSQLRRCLQATAAYTCRQCHSWLQMFTNKFAFILIPTFSRVSTRVYIGYRDKKQPCPIYFSKFKSISMLFFRIRQSHVGNIHPMSRETLQTSKPTVQSYCNLSKSIQQFSRESLTFEFITLNGLLGYKCHKMVYNKDNRMNLYVPTI